MSHRVIIMRDAIVRIVKMLAEKEVKVTMRGARAFVEYGHTGRPLRVNIPYLPDDASDELLDAVQGFIDHEVAHILFTDYRVLAEAKKLKLSDLHNIIEDSFIERKMAQHFAGSGANLRNVGSFFLKTFTDKELAAHPENAEGLLLVPAVRAWAGQSVFADYMEDKWHYMANVTAALGDAVKKVALCATSKDCLDVAIEFRDLLEAAKPKKPKAPPAPPAEDEEGEGDPMPGSGSAGGSIESFEDPEPGEGADPEPEIDHDPVTDPDAPIPELDVGRYKTPETEGTEEAPPAHEGEEPSEDPEPAPEEAGEEEPPIPEELPPGGDEPDGIVISDEEPETDPGMAGGDEGVGDAPEMKEEDHGATAESEGEGGDSDDEMMDGPGGADDESTSGSGAPSMSGDEEGEDEGPSLMDEIARKMGEKAYDDAISEALTSKAVEDSKSADYLVYTTELDVIEPMPVSSRHYSDAHLKMMTDTVDHMVGPLQKDLERAMAARSAATWSAGHRSGRLHPSALARLTAFGDDRVFRRKHVNESKDVAVMLLVDCSGSMTGSKIRTAAYAAYGLSAVLDRMMITHEVMGFTTQDNLPAELHAEESRLGIRYARYETLYMPILKGFTERLNSENKKRFAALPSVNWLSENVDGECVQIAAQRLATRREKRKILMVLSDGQPACPGDFRLLANHLKKSVRDVEKSGIDVIGIGIQSDAPRHFYSKHVVLSDVAELPNTVIGQLRKFLMN